MSLIIVRTLTLHESMNTFTKEVAEGKHVGKTVWLCSLHFRDYNKKPFVWTQPIQVKIVEEEWGRDKDHIQIRTYFYSTDSKGRQKEVMFYRTSSWFDEHASLFETEQECRDFYRDQVNKALQGIEDEKIHAVARLDNQMRSLKDTL